MNKYLKKMLYALTSAYSRKDYDNLQSGKPVETNIGKLFSIFAWGLDKVQEQADLIKLWDDLDYAEGKVLDRYGANFGVKRGGASDPLYRLFIKVKMIAQLSSGDEDTVVKAAAEFLGVEYTDLLSEDVYPAKKWLYVDFKLLPKERLELIEQIAHAIKRTIAAGVGFRLYLRTYRTFVMPLPIYHGGAIGENLFMQPVGQDRSDTSPLPISHGAEIHFDMEYGPVGRDRLDVSLLPINHCADIHFGMRYDPVGQERQDVSELPVSHGAEIVSGAMRYEPVAKPREASSPVDVSTGAILPLKISSGIVPGEHTFSEAVTLAQGGVSRPSLDGDVCPTTKSPPESGAGASAGLFAFPISSHVESSKGGYSHVEF